MLFNYMRSAPDNQNSKLRVLCTTPCQILYDMHTWYSIILTREGSGSLLHHLPKGAKYNTRFSLVTYER